MQTNVIPAFFSLKTDQVILEICQPYNIPYSIPQHQSSLTQTTLHPSPYKTLSQQPATWFYVIVLRGKTTNSNKLSVGIEWLLHDKMRWYPILFGMTVFKLFNISIKLDHPSFFWDLSIKTQILQRVSLFI